MKLSSLSPFMIALAMAFSAQAEDVVIQSIAQGACWVEEGPESLKIASFNDRESLLTSRDDIGWQVEELVSENKKNKAQTSDLNLHCGGYGSSLVVKAEVNSLPVCLWLKLNKGKLEIRSMGGLEVSKNSKDNLCDGYKWQELIVGVKSLAQKELLENNYKDMIKTITVVSGATLKVVLTPEFKGREAEAQEILSKSLDLKYVELNLYQHPVGEVLPLK